MNDPLAPFAPNNDPATAQAVPNPVILGGFASANGTGVQGDKFAANGDAFDAFRVTLAEGQKITLNLGGHIASNPTRNDLDLYLFTTNDTTTPVASSVGTGAVESIVVPAPSRDYFVVVNAFRGISNYVLTIGQPTASSAGASALSSQSEFVPGQVIVRFKDAALPADGSEPLKARAKSMGLSAKAGGPRRETLMTMGDGDDTQRKTAFAALGIDSAAIDNAAGKWGLGAATMEERLRYDTLRVVKALRARSDIASADLNYIYRATAIPNDQFYSSQWHYPLINLPQAWDITTGDANVIVAVVDTGVLYSHPDLFSKLTSTGYDFVSNPSAARDGDGIDANADDPGDSQTPGGSSFHGTHVAGTIAAASNNSTGVAGVSWQSSIMPVRVLGQGGGTSYDIMQGVRYAAGLPNDSGIVLSASQRADIINLSLGGGGPSSAEQGVYNDVRNAGVIVIAAAGNANSSQLQYPASYDNVVSVSAVDARKQRAPYSSFGGKVDVAAPGGDTSVDRDGNGIPDCVVSTLADDSSGSRTAIYNVLQGTSMAAPHVAGVAALMKAVHPNLTPAQFDAALSSGSITEDLGAGGRDDEFGYGLIDALKAVQVANTLASGGALPPVLEIDPGALNLGNSATSAILNTRNAGGGSFAITGVTDDAPWLTVTATNVDANGIGEYTATVNRSGLVDAIYNATITFTTNTAGVQKSSVSMRVGGGVTSSGNTGFQFVLLLNSNTFETLRSVGVANNNGAYTYSFANVPPGSYALLAGSDADNDGIVCDAAESCGGFPTLDQLQKIVVADRDVSGLNFSSSFSVSLGAASASTNQESKGFNRIPGKRLGR